MSDIKVFKIAEKGISELAGQSVAVEKSLQTLIERNLEIFLGVRFLASEYSTGKVQIAATRQATPDVKPGSWIHKPCTKAGGKNIEHCEKDAQGCPTSGIHNRLQRRILRRGGIQRRFENG